MIDLYKGFTTNAAKSFPHLYDDTVLEILNKGYDNMSMVCRTLDGNPWTLMHNDCNVRNMCLRETANGKSQHSLCLYDWELVRIGVPQHDLVEFLMFILPEECGTGVILDHIEYYRSAFERELFKRDDLSEYVRTSLDSNRFMEVFDMAVVEFLWNRLGLYMMGHRFAPLSYIERVVKNTATYLKYARPKYDFLT